MVRSSPRLFRTLAAWMLLGLVTLLAVPGPALSSHPARAAGQPETAVPAHYFVLRQLRDGTIRPLYHARVLVAGLASFSDSQMAAALALPERDRERLAVALRAPDGALLFQSVVDVPQWLRGEFSGAGGSIDGHVLPAEEPTFVVRVPALPRATLVLAARTAEGLPRTAEFDLDRLAASTPAIDLGDSTLSPAAGDPANRFDLLIIGDGYTAAQDPLFQADAQQVASQFFSISPLAEYANYANVHILSIPSGESGADHPPYDPGCTGDDPSCCSDPDMLNDPLQGTFVDTALDARYCSWQIHRLLVTDEAKVYAAAGAVPDWDSILVLVNDATYGGSGGSYSTVAMHDWAVQIAQHEIGHSFALLADEYESPYPGYPPCSDLYGPACEPNVTDVTMREQIKWNAWILPTTPIPTPELQSWDGYVGLFQGARYLPTGIYRSGYNCIMRALGRPFCQVPAQTYVLRLYDGGWGVPAEGISLIEPDTPYPSGPVSLIHPAQETFGAEILQPVGGPPVGITWLVDGVLVPGEHSPAFTYETRPGQLGPVEITLVVQDATPLVHPAMAGDSLISAYTWAVEVYSGLYLPLVARDE